MPERAIDRLSGFLTQTTADQIPSATLLRAADCALDAIGSALAGRDAHSVQAMQAVICAEMQAGQSQIWFSGKNSNPIGAATINAMAATALDVDDGHRMAAGHPGAAIIAAASAVANQTGASFGDYLVAIVVAYEAAVRVALAPQPGPSHIKSQRPLERCWRGGCNGEIAEFVGIGHGAGYPDRGTTGTAIVLSHAPRLCRIRR